MSGFVGTYGWWILGLALLGLEVVVPGVFLLFFGIAALVVGTNALLFPDASWQSEIVGFVVVSAVAVLLGYRWYGQRHVASDRGDLNQRTARLVGRTATLSEPIDNGRGRIALEDGWWTVEGPDLPAGARVVVAGAEGAMLRVAPAPRETGAEGDPGRS